MDQSLERDILPVLEPLLEQLLIDKNIVGLSVGLVQNAELVWSRALGVSNYATGEVLTEAHLMDAGSLTKPVFAYTVLLLHRNGLLDLDAPLSEFLEDQYIPDERIHLVTARMCLSHSPGFPNWRPGMFSDKPEALKIHLTPGTRYSYSGEGYFYLQKVVEAVMSQPLDQIVREFVLEPLCMTSSGFTVDGIEQQPIAAGHASKNKPAIYHYPKPNAAFSLRSTPADFSKFLTTVLAAPGNDSRLLNDKEIKQMLSPQIRVTDDLTPYDKGWPKDVVQKNPRVSWSLGWGLQHEESHDLIWHWGDNGVYKAFTLASPRSGTGLVLMSNCYSGSKIWRAILQTLYGEDLPILPYMDLCNPGYL
jgi:CubicO group peptidase (beta-lactamase class C family)